jgi:Holliday junction DNA helicase RuvA
MLSYIQGILTEKTPTYAVIDCSGVGFLLFISVNTYASLPELNQKCKLHTHLTIKSEATTPVGLVMYGFTNVEERSIFLELISVSGIGSNTARLILSSLTTTEVISAISNGDVFTFKNVKGIGEKTAQRIIIDLKDKISKIPHSKDFFLPQHNNMQNEALSALIMLGFNKNTAEKVIEKVIKTQGVNISLEEMIKQALKLL